MHIEKEFSMNAFGLTGNIGCGKSTVASLLAKYPGVLVLDCDHISKEILAHSADRQEINTVLGMDVFPDGKANFAQIATIIFGDAEKKSLFEALIHPLMWMAVQEKMTTSSDKKLCIVESALLYETESEHKFTGVIVAHCNPEEQLRRLKEDRGMNLAHIEARLAAQLPAEEKVARAQFVIHTDCSRDELKRRVDVLHQQLTGQK